MKLTGQDELSHPPTTEALWRESHYFNFHDASGKIGGITSIGVWPNRDRAEGIVAIYLSAQRVLAYRLEGPLTGDGSPFSLGDIRYEMLEPFQRWRLRAEGDFMTVDPRQGEELTPEYQPPVRVQLDLTWEALSPPYEYPPETASLIVGPSRHYEQTGRIQGVITIGGQEMPINGYSSRDHSWGIRDWLRPQYWRLILAQFGPHLTVNAFLGRTEVVTVVSGFVYQGGSNHPIEQVIVEVDPGPAPHLPRGATADVVTADGLHLSLKATVTSTLPVVFSEGQGMIRVDEALARFQCGDQTGYGILELGTRLS